MTARLLLIVAFGLLLSCQQHESVAPIYSLQSAAIADDSIQPADAGDDAWVQRAVPLLWGRRVLSSAETRVLSQLVRRVGRAEATRLMTRHPDYINRWEVWLKDALSVNRLGFGANPVCYGTSVVEADAPNAVLANFLSENGPGEDTFDEPFTMRDVIRSALVADDVSVVYRAHLIAHLTRALDDMRLLAAMSQRRNRAETFMMDYLNRQMSCLGCHNSEFSVTDTVDEASDRAWPIEGPFERLVFLDPTGLSDVDELSGFFRRKGVLAKYHYTHDEPELVQVILAQKGRAPWGWDADACGNYLAPEDRFADDALTAAGDALHSTFIKDHGPDGSIFDLEQYLHAGVDALKVSEAPAESARVEPSAAFAYMVAMSFVDQVWAEAFGHRLTIATHFPRNRYQRDILNALADTSVENGFSIREVLVFVTTHPYFNGDLPAAGDMYRPVFDPFVDDEQPVEQRRNGLGHTVHRAPARVLLRTLAKALGWPELPEFLLYYMSPEAKHQRSVGVFLKTGDPGFSGTSFQSALAWEALYGVCSDQSTNGQCPLTPILENEEAQLATVKELCASRACACDWDARCCDIDWAIYCSDDIETGDPDTLNLCTYPRSDAPAYGDVIRRLAESVSSSDASWRDALRSLKDRLLGTGRITPDAEQSVIEALLDVELDNLPRSEEDIEGKLRLACGLWLTTPDFHLLGDPGVPSEELLEQVPTLIPGSDFQSTCSRLTKAMSLEAAKCGDTTLDLADG